MFTPLQIIILIITGISFIDFLVFIGLFLTFVINVTINAKDYSTKSMSILIIILFLLFKILHIPVFLSTVEITSFKFPYTDIVLGFLTWVNITLAVVPLFFGMYTSLIKTKPNVENFEFNDVIFICMPIYNEKPSALWAAIQSVNNVNYNKKCLHLILSFDDDGKPEAFIDLLFRLNLMHHMELPEINFINNGLKISILRTKHGGKKSAQLSSYNFIKKSYNSDILKKSYIFYIDSDIILDKNSIKHFMFHMKTYNKTVLTGMITCMAKKRDFLTYYQDVEYVSGQILTRNLEDAFNGTLCIPGALGITKFSSFEKIATEYFKENDYQSMFEHSRNYAGEDRRCTDLMIQNDENLGYCQYATCKTECPDNLKSLRNQRARWYKGSISNDVWTMSSIKIWKNYPLLSLFSFLNNTRNTSIYVYLLYFVLLFNHDVSVLMWLLFIILPIGLLWIFITIHAIKVNRKMNIIFYPLILLLQPLLGMVYMYYTIYSLNNRGWGSRKNKKQVPI
jgi:cellulose synthase/poly-beta-1,6-N-acetylglucosamine synthase-like glycosyltransferase